MSKRVKQQGKEPEEWARGTAEAEAARELVAEQLATLLREREMTGDRAYLGRRLAELLEAERVGDRTALRAAAMELTVAGAAWVVALDLGHPVRRARAA